MIVLIDEFENHSKLNTLLFRSKRNKAKENKNRHIYEHMAILQISTYVMFTLPKWFETINKLNLILNEPKTITFESKKSKTKENNNINQGTYDNSHFCKFFPLVFVSELFAFAMLSLFRLFANNKKINITLTEPKTNKRENKTMHLYAYGHFCKNYQDTYFEPLWLIFSKLNFPSLCPSSKNTSR
jgi:hypothetical protein